MKNKRFSHFTDVFSFTFKQASKGKGYVVMTFVVPIILFAVFMAVNIILAQNAQEFDRIAEKVYVIDETGTDLITGLIEASVDRELYPELQVVKSDETDPKEACKKIGENDTHSFVIKVSQDEESGKITILTMVPEWSEIESKEYNEIAGFAEGSIMSYKVFTSGIDVESLVYLSSYVDSEVVAAGDKPEDESFMMVKALVPMVVMLILYFVLILYGQSTGKVVAIEKNSKLMEDFLTTIHPDALIMGKVLAMSAMSIMQMLLWLVGGIAGFKVGEMVGKSVNPDYTNVISSFLSDFAEQTSSAFTPISIIMGIVAMITTITMFGFIAGLFGSLVSKPEELASTMGVYNIVIVASFFGGYFPMMSENEGLKNALRIFPMTGAFVLPADIAIGSAGYLIGGIGLGLLILTCIILAVVSAKIYKGRVFYRGNGAVKTVAGLFKKTN